ncbi:MAG: hypothetical protein Greene041662_499 [Candidatus Peregrinibacteria bacterium Greene0416_62]|nr:MAG: hypothetical protein Greene041662_499 [Candidatus Peregrinibacteria bacterium Greene0416_62]
MKFDRELLLDCLIGWAVQVMQGLETASGERRQSYHGLSHAGSHVYRTARRFAKIVLEGDPKDYMKVLDLMCVGHDLIQNSVPGGKAHFKFEKVVLRNRKRGPNEVETAALILAKIDTLDTEGWITAKERAAIKNGIEFTIPEWNAEVGTMYQRGLFEALDAGDVDPLAVALPVGDLLLCGAFPTEFILASDALLIEECQGLCELLLQVKRLDAIPEDVQQQHLEYFRFWDAGQASFASGQQKLTFARILQAFPGKATKLKEAFRFFDESVLRAGERANTRSQWSFRQYLTGVGFPVPI